MSDALKRIEEKHRARHPHMGGGGTQCRACRTFTEIQPCDVLKLARAISQYLREYDTPAPDLTLRIEYRKQLRRTLEEVAGE